MIKAVIIEDDDKSMTFINNMLREHFAHIKVMALCRNNEEAKAAIETLNPDLVLSDIELKNESVFDMLQQLKDIDFEIIFTTGYDKYALQAIRFSALDYLLKPFAREDLENALHQFDEKKNKKQSSRQLNALFYNLKHIQKDLKKIALPTQKGLEVFPVKDVIRCESEVNYTSFYLTAKSKIVVSKTLKEYEELLSEYDFFRVHHSHLINLHQVKKYVKKDGGVVIMSDGTEIDVSRRKKEEFLSRLEAL